MRAVFTVAIFLLCASTSFAFYGLSKISPSGDFLIIYPCGEGEDPTSIGSVEVSIALRSIQTEDLSSYFQSHLSIIDHTVGGTQLWQTQMHLEHWTINRCFQNLILPTPGLFLVEICFQTTMDKAISPFAFSHLHQPPVSCPLQFIKTQQ